MTAAVSSHRRYRHADLADLPDGQQYEIIDGELADVRIDLVALFR
jgi:hypothetical protein